MAKYRIHTKETKQYALELAYGRVTYEGVPEHEWVNINAGMSWEAKHIWLVETDEENTAQIEQQFERDDVIVSWDRLEDEEDQPTDASGSVA